MEYRDEVKKETLGAIVGIAIFDGPQSGFFYKSLPLQSDDWSVGPYVHYLANVSEFDEPIPHKGKQGTWKVCIVFIYVVYHALFEFATR